MTHSTDNSAGSTVGAPITGEQPTPRQPLLRVDDLHVDFQTYGGVVQAVRGVSFEVAAGQTLAIVGESGCGKSVTVQSLMGLIPMPPGRIHKGTATLRGHDILASKFVGGQDIRGRKISMIFQDPMTSLNPTMTIGRQIAETLEVHRGYSQSQAFNRAVELLEMSKIPEAAKRAKQYPFEFSGGMLQRAMIAMAIACEPAILVADEPTTALDVTIQAQILDLLGDLQLETGMAIILITHDLGVVARMADDVMVMYAGEVVERGSVDDIFYRSGHPYTQGLRLAMPSNKRAEDGGAEQTLLAIDGSPPDLFNPPTGCAYHPRCPHAMNVCAQQAPAQYGLGSTSASNQGLSHQAACWLHHELCAAQKDQP